MIDISQETHNLLGSKADIENLAQKDHARILVVSDSHRNTGVFRNIVKNFGKECDALAFCGDGFCDLAQIIEESQTDSDLAESLPKVIAFARGNGDPATYPIDEKKSLIIPSRQLLTVNGRNFLIVHGHNEGVDWTMESIGMEMQLTDSKVAFYGHTHIAKEENISNYKMVNPGSCSRPRGGQPACFAIATVEKTFVDIAFIKIERDGFRVWNPIF